MFKNNKAVELINEKVKEIRKNCKEIENLYHENFVVPWARAKENDFSLPRLAVITNLLALNEIKDNLLVIENLNDANEEEIKEILNVGDIDPKELYDELLEKLRNQSLENICDCMGLPPELYSLVSMLPPGMVYEFVKEIAPKEILMEIEQELGRKL